MVTVVIGRERVRFNDMRDAFIYVRRIRQAEQRDRFTRNPLVFAAVETALLLLLK